MGTWEMCGLCGGQHCREFDCQQGLHDNPVAQRVAEMTKLRGPIFEDNVLAYPDNNPKTVMGLKKPDPFLVPPAAIAYMALGMGNGKAKYGPYNWREKKVSSSVYVAAAIRHLLAWVDGEENAEDSGLPHLGHALSSLAILVDAKETGNLNDDRPPAGVFAEIIRRYTKE